MGEGMTTAGARAPAAQAPGGSGAPAEHLPRALLLVVAALTAILPLSTDGLSPALPAVSAGLGVPTADVAGLMSAFVIAFAAVQLVCGMLADALGRRPIIYGGLILYVAASLLGALARDFPMLMLARVLQGLGCAAIVLLARTIVRDLLDRVAAARTLGLVGAIYGPVPILVPLASGALVTAFGWRAPLLGMALVCAFVMLASLRALPETLRPAHRLPLDPRGVARSLMQVARSRPLLAYMAGNAFAYTGILLFSAAGPRVIVDHLGQSIGAYAMMFALSTGGFVIGSFVSSRIVHRCGMEATLRLGTLLQITGGLVMIAATLAAPERWAALIFPQMIYTFGWGFVQPQMQAGALSLHPRAIGQASALLGFGQLATAGIVVALFARLSDGSALSLALGMAFCAVMALVIAWGFIRTGEAAAG